MSRSSSFASPYAPARGATAAGTGEPISGLNITPLITSIPPPFPA